VFHGSMYSSIRCNSEIVHANAVKACNALLAIPGPRSAGETEYPAVARPVHTFCSNSPIAPTAASDLASAMAKDSPIHTLPIRNPKSQPALPGHPRWLVTGGAISVRNMREWRRDGDLELRVVRQR
jgi:hypothetical protein